MSFGPFFDEGIKVGVFEKKYTCPYKRYTIIAEKKRPRMSTEKEIMACVIVYVNSIVKTCICFLKRKDGLQVLLLSK